MSENGTPTAEAKAESLVGISPESLKRYPNLEKIIGMELPVIVVLGEKASTLEEVLSLTKGSLIVFKKHNSESLDVLVNNRRIGAGKVIKAGERFAIQIRQVGTPREILEKIR